MGNLHIFLEDDLHKKLKKKAIDKDILLKEAVVEAVEEYVN